MTETERIDENQHNAANAHWQGQVAVDVVGELLACDTVEAIEAVGEELKAAPSWLRSSSAVREAFAARRKQINVEAEGSAIGEGR